MGHSHLDGAHTHATSSGIGALDQAAQLVAVIAVAVAGVDVVMWLLHILLIIATSIGFAVLGAGGGYAWVKMRQLRTRRYRDWAQPDYPPLYPAAQFPPYRSPRTPVLPSANGDLHLHLPPGLTASEVAEIMRSPRTLPAPPERGDAR